MAPPVKPLTNTLSNLCCCSVFQLNTNVSATLTLCWLSPDSLQVFWTFHLLTWALKRTTWSISTLCTPGSCTATKWRVIKSQRSLTPWSLSVRSERSPDSHRADGFLQLPSVLQPQRVLVFAEHNQKKYLRSSLVFGQAPVAHSSGDALCQGQWGDEWNGGEGQTQVLRDANGDGQWDQLSFVLFVFYRLCLSTWIRGAICHPHTSLMQKPFVENKMQIFITS